MVIFLAEIAAIDKAGDATNKSVNKKLKSAIWAHLWYFGEFMGCS
jgi:hypothetical protein